MNNLKKKISENIKKFYWASFFREWMFIIPVVVLFWQQNGLSLTQIMILQSIYAISIVLLEVPTGVIADKWGRKQSMILGALFLILGTIIYGLGHNFLQFILAEVVWGLGGCFFSGADSAFVYDSLKQIKKEDTFKKVLGNAKSWGYLAAGVAGIIGGFVATYSLRLNWFLSTLGMIFLFLVVLSYNEPKHFEKVHKKSYWKHTKESFKEAFNNKNILFLLLFYALIMTVAKISLWFYQPYMAASGINIAYFGIIWASFTLFAILGSKSSHNVEKYLGASNSLWLMIFLSTLSLIFMSYFFVIFGIFFIYFQQYLRGFNGPVLNDYTNKQLSSENRATLLSIQSLAGNLLFAIVGPIFGYLADKLSLSSALLITGVIFLAVFAALMLWRKKIT